MTNSPSRRKRKREDDDNLPQSKLRHTDLNDSENQTEINGPVDVFDLTLNNTPEPSTHSNEFSKLTPQVKRNHSLTETENREDFTKPEIKRRITDNTRKQKLLIEQSKEPKFLQSILLSLRESVIGKCIKKFTKLIPSNAAKTVFLIIEGVQEFTIQDKSQYLGDILEIFTSCDEVFLGNASFALEVKNAYNFIPRQPPQDSYSILFPARTNVQITESLSSDKLKLLLHPVEMLENKYPLPQEIVPFSNSDGYRYTKDNYNAVDENSPMFALDCETFMRNRFEKDLQWMALVDENQDLVCEYRADTAPADAEENMINVKKAQDKLINSLSSNAILCGQSLNFDLHYLNLIHPYVIDTSVIFQTCENKHSLRELTQFYLGENIQGGAKHSPIEDSVATMKLVQFKLDSISAEETSSTDSTNTSNSINNQDRIDFTQNDVHHQHSLFNLISEYSKRIIIIGNQEDLTAYGTDFVPESGKKDLQEDIKNVLTATKESISQYDVVISHMHITHNLQDSITTFVNEIYENCPTKTDIMAIIAPEADDSEGFRKALFLTTFKQKI